MLKDILEIGKQVFAVAREMRQNKSDSKELRERQDKQEEELKEVRQELRRMTEIMQRFAYEYQHQNEKSETERRLLLLEVENMLLRQGRSLPSPEKPYDDQSQ